MSGENREDGAKENSSKSSNVSRRSILQGIGIGIATPGIGIVRGNDRTVGVVTEVGRDEKVVRQVPRGWYEHEQIVDSVFKELGERYKDNKEVSAISIKKTDKKSEV